MKPILLGLATALFFLAFSTAAFFVGRQFGRAEAQPHLAYANLRLKEGSELAQRAIARYDRYEELLKQCEVALAQEP